MDILVAKIGFSFLIKNSGITNILLYLDYC